ncbi:aldehyde dehydrogenase family protein [Streptomyces triticagri]|uniref:Aldehyde dehydrogenase family protein n=1 Tax=Streptomyces triticagri TaxID=2293568 RepID=A0A372M914_9ACTN|nr:aldehyde dehydrogenase family protein [Streptomyces triticagri]RFU86787.1 aldehyde dehydrogenase family protein [Streptomyces triticagri]
MAESQQAEYRKAESRIAESQQVASPPADLPPLDALDALDALGPRGPYRTRKRATVTDVTGTPRAELSLVPGLFAERTAKALRSAPPLPPDQRAAALGRAAILFATGTVDGRGIDEHERTVSRVSGLPLTVVRDATRNIATRLAAAHGSADRARPRGAVPSWREAAEGDGSAVWARRGEVFAVHAAGNHPGTHSLWPEALALGHRVMVRPSRREPFTPHRLISALRTAGFGADRVALLPTDHDQAGAVLRAADLGMVYGGDEVVRKYAGDPRVLPQGPGRSKILLAGDSDWRDHLDTVVASVSHHGGTGCVNTTAVYVEETAPGTAAAFTAALAERLGALPVLPPQDEKAVLPVQPAATAQAIARHLQQRAGSARRFSPADAVADLGDGSAVLRPAVHLVDGPDAPQLGAELPFPCVWVAPWTPRDGVAPLRGSLVLTAVTEREELIGRLLDEPTISNLYLGDTPTYRIEPGLPHDGYLAEFLMHSKSVIKTPSNH